MTTGRGRAPSVVQLWLAAMLRLVPQHPVLPVIEQFRELRTAWHGYGHEHDEQDKERTSVHGDTEAIRAIHGLEIPILGFTAISRTTAEGETRA